MTNTNIFRFVYQKRHLLGILLLAAALFTVFTAKTSAANVGTGRIKVTTYLNFSDAGKKTDARLPYVNVYYKCKSPTAAFDYQWISTNANGVAVTPKLAADYRCLVRVRPPKGYKISSGSKAVRTVKIKKGKILAVDVVLVGKKGNAQALAYQSIPEGGSVQVNTWLDNEDGGTAKDVPISTLGAIYNTDPKAKCVYYGNDNTGIVDNPRNASNAVIVAPFVTDTRGIAYIQRCSPGSYQMVPLVVFPGDLLTNPDALTQGTCPLEGPLIKVQNGRFTNVDLTIKRSHLYLHAGEPNFNYETCVLSS